MLGSTKWFMSLILLLSVAGQTNAGQILMNPGFESGSLAPWYAQSNTPVVTNAQAHTGTYSVKAGGSDEIRQDFTPIPTSEITELSFWAMRVGGTLHVFKFYYSDGSTGATGLSQFTSNWTLFDVTSNLASGKNLSGISVFGTSEGAFLDDFSLVTTAAPVPEPSSFALLGLGGIGLAIGAYRRRPAAR